MTIDGAPAATTYRQGHAVVSLRTVRKGAHKLVVTVSDYQELKNMENVPQILPNTRVFRAAFSVR